MLRMFHLILFYFQLILAEYCSGSIAWSESAKISYAPAHITSVAVPPFQIEGSTKLRLRMGTMPMGGDRETLIDQNNVHLD